MGKEESPQQTVLGHLGILMQTNKQTENTLNLYLTPYTKTNLKRIIDKNLQNFWKETQEKISVILLEKDLDAIPTAQSIHKDPAALHWNSRISALR